MTGFGFPLHHFGAPHVVGIISLDRTPAIAIYARYPKGLAGAWRRIYIVSALIALYLNVFVGIVQSFQKLPALNALAPTQTEPPPLPSRSSLSPWRFVLLTVVGTIRFAGRHRNSAAAIGG